VKKHEEFIGAFAYHYKHLEFERCFKEGFYLTCTARMSRATGETLSHSGHFEFERSYLEGP